MGLRALFPIVETSETVLPVDGVKDCRRERFSHAPPWRSRLPPRDVAKDADAGVAACATGRALARAGAVVARAAALGGAAVLRARQPRAASDCRETVAAESRWSCGCAGRSHLQ